MTDNKNPITVGEFVDQIQDARRERRSLLVAYDKEGVLRHVVDWDIHVSEEYLGQNEDSEEFFRIKTSRIVFVFGGIADV